MQTERELVRRVLEGSGDGARTVDCGRLPEGSYRIRVGTGEGGSASDAFVVCQID